MILQKTSVWSFVTSNSCLLTSNFTNMKYQVNEKGYYGEFGGAWIPEMMFTNIDELKTRYLEIIESDEFIKEFDQLMKDYVGRPSPLYYAGRLSEK